MPCYSAMLFQILAGVLRTHVLSFLLLKLWSVSHGVDCHQFTRCMICMRSTSCLPCYACFGFCCTCVHVCVAAYLMHPELLRKVHRMLHMPVQLASKVRHALCWAQVSTARGDPRIRKVEEDIDGVKQAQLKCQQDLERLMQKKHQSKADMTLLPLLLKQREEMVEELKQLREKELLLLRQLYK